MLIFDMRTAGNKLHSIRKSQGLTQADVAELAGLSDRAYADIERGTVNMRVETLLKICDALRITPDMVFAEHSMNIDIIEADVLARLQACGPKQKATALRLLSVYLDSL